MVGGNNGTWQRMQAIMEPNVRLRACRSRALNPQLCRTCAEWALGRLRHSPTHSSSAVMLILRGASHERKEGGWQEHLLKMIGSGG